MPHLFSTLLLVVKICVLSFLVRRWWCWEQKSLSEFGRNLQLKTGFPLAKSSPDRHPGAGSVHVRVQVKPSVPARVQLQKLPSSVQRDFEKRPSAANFDVRLCVCVWREATGLLWWCECVWGQASVFLFWLFRRADFESITEESSQVREGCLLLLLPEYCANK